jgi:uncharacterized protein
MLILWLLIFFALVSLGASFVNGAIGYGYSSISTPLALLVLVNKIVNPAYVLLEAMVNTVMAILSGKKNLQATFRRTLPIMLAVAPGAVIGSLILYGLSSSFPSYAKFVVYAAILPLILLQTAGLKKAIKRETAAGVPLGFGIGLLYSITTISGPPIALFWNNQGLKKEEFKAAIAQVRITESYITCISYYLLGFYTAKSSGWFGTVTPLQLFEVIAPPVLVGLPLGILVVKKMNVNTFPRIAMTFNALIVDYGLTRVLMLLFKLNVNIANLLFAGIAAIAVYLLYRYFNVEKVESPPPYASVPVLNAAQGSPPPPISPTDSANSQK